MGPSSRAAQVIEPGNGDLLMPDRRRVERPARAGDVEDACFETVSPPSGEFPAHSFAAVNEGDSGVRSARAAAQAPFPAGFSNPAPIPEQAGGWNGRLDVFSARPAAPVAGGSRFAATASVLVAGLCGLAAAMVWLSASPAPQPEARAPAAIFRAPVASAPMAPRPAAVPDPVTTSSVPAKLSDPAKSGFSAPLPKPARIERAGSILMIRPASD